MIRFCDKEVMCIEFNQIERSKLLHFFLNGHLKDSVCVVDDTGEYMGMITYYSLLYSISINGAILRHYVTMDENIWENAKLIFSADSKDEYKLIPVMNKKGQLISFIYEDNDANRELRMLRELTEKEDAIQFSDLYSEYRCVRIYGFNELAVALVRYLRKQGVAVQLQGELWEYVKEESCNEPFLDYQYMNIYAEGIGPRHADWRENLLRTVSVEFEIVDKIYAANVKQGIIESADGDCRNLIKTLQSVQYVAILGTGVESQDAYDYLLQNEVEVCCFITAGSEVQGDRLFGKPVLNLREAISRYDKELVFIECIEKNSVWGLGHFGADYFDYMGFERNKKFFCLRDYIQLQGNCIKTVLKNRKVILAGDYYLCERLTGYLKKCGCDKDIHYLEVSEDKEVLSYRELEVIGAEELDANMLCLIVQPEYHDHPAYAQVRKKYQKKEEKIREILKKKGICDYSDYFSHITPFISIERETRNKYPHKNLLVNKIVLGSINSHNGNFFFRGLLDGHPSIMLWDKYSFLNNNLFWFCVRLADRDIDEIVLMLERIHYLEDVDEEFNDERFRIFLDQIGALLIQGERYTSQELFIAFHIAQMGMKCNMAEGIIYWEPHFLQRNHLEECVQWLSADNFSCEIINVVRDTCNVRGSLIKDNVKGDPKSSVYGAVCIDGMFEVPKKNRGTRRVVRFEDLKCNPESELQNLCKNWKIPWSEQLMSVTCRGEHVSYYNGEKDINDFDLTPVYNKYEDYLSEFDRFRLTLIGFSWQKTYGYPCVDPLQFSRRDLQEMFLQEFRFSKEIEFDSEEDKLLYYIKLQQYIRQSLWCIRVISWLDKFGTKD